MTFQWFIPNPIFSREGHEAEMEGMKNEMPGMPD
jgi:hypothetical protein